jgi:hypothetical protein
MHSLPSASHPIAFATLPWQLVAAIIVFNIVAGMISKRKQKQAKAGAKTEPKTDPKAEARLLEEARLREAAETKRKAAERRAREEILRARDEARGSGEPAEAGTGGASEARTRPTAPAGNARPTGKRILDQLARELGLELPEARQPVPAPARPSSRQASAPAPVEPVEAPVSARIPIASVAPIAAPASPSFPGAADFSDPEAMRKAFILKVILDKPPALRHRR